MRVGVQLNEPVDLANQQVEGAGPSECSGSAAPGPLPLERDVQPLTENTYRDPDSADFRVRLGCATVILYNLSFP